MKGGSQYGGGRGRSTQHGGVPGSNNHVHRVSNRRPRGGGSTHNNNANNAGARYHGGRGGDNHYNQMKQKFNNFSVGDKYQHQSHGGGGNAGNGNGNNSWNNYNTHSHSHSHTHSHQNQQSYQQRNKYNNININLNNQRNPNPNQMKSFTKLPAEFCPREGLPRRPFLHIVVLFASDPRVMAYAESVANKFLDAGIDVWLMTETSRMERPQSNNYNNRQARWIKPEHLVSIITNSKSDSLIVLGDRNMKNDTCQERKSGKLIEVPVNESIDSLLQFWAQQTGLRYFKPVRNFYINGNDNISEDILLNCVRDLTGTCGHALNRLERIQEIAEELRDWEKQNKKLASSAGGNSSNSSSVKLNSIIYSEQDQAQVAKLTRNQNAAIKFDHELREAQTIVNRLRLFEPDDPRQDNSVFIIDLGLGRGLDVSMYENFYGPPQPRMASKDAAEFLVHWGPVSPVLKNDLLNVIVSVMEKVSLCGEIMTAVATFVGGVSLWSEYLKEVEKNNAKMKLQANAISNSLDSSRGGKSHSNSRSSSIAVSGGENSENDNQSNSESNQKTDEEETLCAMGFELEKVRYALVKADGNVEDALNILLQGGADNVGNDPEDEGWSMTGQAGKLQRQKKKQEQERREMIKTQRQKQQKQESQQHKPTVKQQPHGNPHPKYANRGGTNAGKPVNVNRSKTSIQQPLKQKHNEPGKSISSMPHGHIQYNQVAAAQANVPKPFHMSQPEETITNESNINVNSQDVSILKSGRFSTENNRSSDNTLPAWGTNRLVGYGTDQEKPSQTQPQPPQKQVYVMPPRNTFAAPSMAPSTSDSTSNVAWQQHGSKGNVDTTGHGVNVMDAGFASTFNLQDAPTPDSIDNSFLLPSFLPPNGSKAEKDESNLLNMGFPSVPPLGSWLKEPTQSDQPPVHHGRSHSSSLDEMVETANASFLKAGAQEFVPMGSRQSDKKPAAAGAASKDSGLNSGLLNGNLGGIQMNGSDWFGSGSTSMQQEHYQHSSGFHGFGQNQFLSVGGAGQTNASASLNPAQMQYTPQHQQGPSGFDQQLWGQPMQQPGMHNMNLNPSFNTEAMNGQSGNKKESYAFPNGGNNYS